MTYYCRLHESFEGVDLGKMTDHIEKEHSELTEQAKNSDEYRGLLREFYKNNVEELDNPMRRSDGHIVARTWGRSPKLGQFVADSEVEKK